jgi:hypothetical protein
VERRIYSALLCPQGRLIRKLGTLLASLGAGHFVPGTDSLMLKESFTSKAAVEQALRKLSAELLICSLCIINCFSEIPRKIMNNA